MGLGKVPCYRAAIDVILVQYIEASGTSWRHDIKQKLACLNFSSHSRQAHDEQILPSHDWLFLFSFSFSVSFLVSDNFRHAMKSNLITQALAALGLVCTTRELEIVYHKL